MKQTDLIKVRTILNWVMRPQAPSFYKKRYKKHDVQRLTPETFPTLPFLTRTDIEAASPYERLYFPEEKVVIAHASSGTTSDKPLVILQGEEYPILQTQYWKTLKRNKVKRLFYLTSTEQIYVKLMTNLADKRYKNVLITVGDRNNLPLSAQIAAQVEIDAIETNASILYFFIPHLKEVYDVRKIRFISLGGEYTSKLKLDYYKKIFPNAKFDFRYGNTEANALGYRCKYLANKTPRLFHPFPQYYYEVINEEGILQKNGEKGELVLTSVAKIAFPLVRYKTGDMIVMQNTPCKCGQKETFDLLGRTQRDFVKVHGTIIHPHLVDQAVKKIKHLITPDYELHIFELNYKGKPLPLLELRLIPTSPNKLDKDLVAKQVADNLFLSPTLNLTKLVERGVFLPLRITFVKKFEEKAKARDIVSHIV